MHQELENSTILFLSYPLCNRKCFTDIRDYEISILILSLKNWKSQVRSFLGKIFLEISPTFLQASS